MTFVGLTVIACPSAAPPVAPPTPVPTEVNVASDELVEARQYGSAQWAFGKSIQAVVLSRDQANGFLLASGRTLYRLNTTGRERIAELPCTIGDLAASPDNTAPRVAVACARTFDQPGTRAYLVELDTGVITDVALPGVSDRVSWIVLNNAWKPVAGLRDGRFLHLRGEPVDLFPSGTSRPAYYKLAANPGGTLLLAEGDEEIQIVTPSGKAVATPVLRDLLGACWLGDDTLVGIDVTDQIVRFSPRATTARSVLSVDSAPDTIACHPPNRVALGWRSRPSATYRLVGDELALEARSDRVVDQIVLGDDVAAVVGRVRVAVHVTKADLSLPTGAHATLLAHHTVSPAGDRAASIDFDGVLNVWDLESSTSRTWSVEPPTQDGLLVKWWGMVWLADGNLYLSSRDRDWRVRPEAPDQPIAAGEAPWRGADAVAADSSGKRVAALTATRGGTELGVWDLDGNGLELSWSKAFVRETAYDPDPCDVTVALDGTAIAVVLDGVEGGEVRVYSPAGQQLAKLPSSKCYAALDKTGSRVATLNDRELETRVVDISTSDVVATFRWADEWDPNKSGFEHLALRPDGLFLAVVREQKVHIYDTRRSGSPPVQVLALPEGAWLPRWTEHGLFVAGPNHVARFVRKK